METNFLFMDCKKEAIKMPTLDKKMHKLNAIPLKIPLH